MDGTEEAMDKVVGQRYYAKEYKSLPPNAPKRKIPPTQNNGWIGNNSNPGGTQVAVEPKKMKTQLKPVNGNPIGKAVKVVNPQSTTINGKKGKIL